MTALTTSRARRARLAFVLVAWLAAAPSVAGHAELASSSPAPDSTVEAPFAGPVVLTFDEPLEEGSRFDLVDAAGRVVDSGRPDGDAAVTMSASIGEPLAAGDYTVRWTSIAADGDVERDTFTFTVAEVEPTPASPTPRRTESPSLAPPESANPSPAPSPAGSGTGASGGDVLFPILAAVAALVILGLVLMRRQTRSRDG